MNYPLLYPSLYPSLCSLPQFLPYHLENQFCFVPSSMGIGLSTVSTAPMGSDFLLCLPPSPPPGIGLIAVSSPRPVGLDFPLVLPQEILAILQDHSNVLSVYVLPLEGQSMKSVYG
jgi:hypothetical protein